MKISTEQGSAAYHFILSGEKGQHDVSFEITNSHIHSNCSCSRQAKNNYCWHQLYILAGKTSRITGGDTSRHKELLSHVASIKGGEKIIAAAQKKFFKDSSCRRCSSGRIVKIKTSPLAWIYCLFRENTHTYFCKDCKWTW